jgi:hypothetical protein
MTPQQHHECPEYEQMSLDMAGLVPWWRHSGRRQRELAWWLYSRVKWQPGQMKKLETGLHGSGRYP